MAMNDLATAAEQAGKLAEETRWYLFGTKARDEAEARDLDVLIVYDHGDIPRARTLAGWLEANGPVPPVDLVLLSAEEERQINFVEKEEAVLVWPKRS
jgi:predicted nucleotidyltransferase